MINKKILLFHSSNDMYGASKIFLQILNLLKNKSFELHVILPSRGILDDLIHKDVTVSYFNLGVLRKKYLNIFGIFNRLVKIYKAFFLIRNYISKNKIDLVYTNTSVIWASGMAARSLKIPSIYHVHEIPFGSFLYENISGYLVNSISTKVICVSDAVFYYWRINIDNLKLVRIYNGIEIPKVLKKQTNIDEILISNISRITPYKGHKYLIEVFKKLIFFDQKFKLLIIGDVYPGNEHYLEELKSLVLKYKLEENIRFLGYRRDINKILSKSNLFIHTPIKPDPLPTVLFESLYSKTPTISTNIGGALEILNNGNNGLLIPLNDSTKSANLIYNYYKNLVKQKQHLKNSELFIKKNFSAKKFYKNILNIITNSFEYK